MSAGAGAAERRYLGRIGGPILDRFDLHVPMSPLPIRRFLDPPDGLTTAAVRERVRLARGFGRTRGLGVNTRLVLMLGNEHLDPLFGAVVQGTEEAIVNALIA